MTLKLKETKEENKENRTPRNLIQELKDKYLTKERSISGNKISSIMNRTPNKQTGKIVERLTPDRKSSWKM